MERVYLTPGQQRYFGACAENGEGDIVVTDADEKIGGWLFVENASTVGEDGSGVWLDADGHEQHGPMGFAQEPTRPQEAASE